MDPRAAARADLNGPDPAERDALRSADLARRGAEVQLPGILRLHRRDPHTTLLPGRSEDRRIPYLRGPGTHRGPDSSGDPSSVAVGSRPRGRIRLRHRGLSDGWDQGSSELSVDAPASVAPQPQEGLSALRARWPEHLVRVST